MLEITYDLDALRAWMVKADNSHRLSNRLNLHALLMQAARSGLLDDAALGRAVRAAAEGKMTEPQVDAVTSAMLASYDDCLHEMFEAAARALLAMQEQAAKGAGDGQ